ncbi:ABC transporter substrate-binding protein [Paeniglutamicibacter antarcticus]|uniref:ABC transporter substrate-binding protein n=1 Tax=Arthrobacter terrae TaxID=2935737 RepID=A0A931CKB8_9MICC|nr:ABC transporter substrate-binding protein [Arthrobacter terrae]MBG0738060.1 ABC transporter substrate-binding protein [Arthrobacter terrae]
MTAKSILLLSTGLLAVAALALTGCTNASQQGAAASASSSSSFNVSAIQKDDTLAAAVPQALRDKGTLVMGSDTSYAPAEFLGGSDGQTPIGYDVDLTKAIGALLGLKVEVQSAAFTSILPSLGPKYDLSASSFFITNQRKQAANFVSYLSAGTQWAVQKGNPKKFSLDDVCGRSIGVQTGSFQETKDLTDRNAKCVAAGKPAIKVVSLQNQTDVTTRLVNGNVDAMPAGSITIAYAITQTKGQLETLGDAYDASPVGIAVAKNDLPFTDLVAKAMNKLIENGDYKKILDEWGVGNVAIPKAEVNPDVPK